MRKRTALASMMAVACRYSRPAFTLTVQHTVKMGVLEFRVFYYLQVGNTSLKTSVLSIR